MLGLKPQELAIILIIILVLFGGSQLPKIAKNLGLAQKEFKKGFDSANDDEDSEEVSES